MEIKIEESLDKLTKHFEGKSGFHVILSDNKSRIQSNFNNPIHFSSDCKHEIGLISLESYYSFPNVDEKNNLFKYRKDQKTEWKIITIPVGCYELKNINEVIQREIKNNGGKKDDIIIQPNQNTFQCILTIKDPYEVDFTIDNSLRTILGFDKNIYKSGRHSSEHPVNILRVNSILVHCNLIGSSYLNGIEEPIIFSFFPDVSPGDKIVIRPNKVIYLPLIINVISQMTVWLTDQNNELLNLRGEELTIKFHIRSCP